MEIYVTLKGTEIMNTPNDFDLGAMVRKKYWEQKHELKVMELKNEPYVLIPDETGLIIGTHLPTSDDYTEGDYDKCVICGKVSPYKTSTHIDLRLGYVEGSGQGCFQPGLCGK